MQLCFCHHTLDNVYVSLWRQINYNMKRCGLLCYTINQCSSFIMQGCKLHFMSYRCWVSTILKSIMRFGVKLKIFIKCYESHLGTLKLLSVFMNDLIVSSEEMLRIWKIYFQLMLTYCTIFIWWFSTELNQYLLWN